MYRLLLIIPLVITCALYIVPLLIIAILAYLCIFLGLHRDLTSTRMVVKFIQPLTYLEKQLKKTKHRK